MTWRQMFHRERPVQTVTQAAHDEVVAVLTAQLAKSEAREQSLRESYEALSFATIKAREPATVAPLVRKGLDPIRQAILDKCGGDRVTAGYLGRWVREEQAKADPPSEDVLVQQILNWTSSDDSLDDAMTA